MAVHIKDSVEVIWAKFPNRVIEPLVLYGWNVRVRTPIFLYLGAIKKKKNLNTNKKAGECLKGGSSGCGGQVLGLGFNV